MLTFEYGHRSNVLAIFFALIIRACNAQSPADYPNNVPGTCTSQQDFDCGNGRCINFNLVRNCVNDCGNNADEQCGVNEVLCDTLVGTGCGKCVASDAASSTCLDRRYARLCDEGIASQPDLPVYKCVNTPNCVLMKWLNDGADDCGDFSDEDPCLQGFNCNLKTSPTGTTFTLCTCKAPFKSNGTVWARPDPLLQSISGSCTSKPLQFDCGGGVCIDIAKFRDCVPDCPNGKDESCWLGTTLCMDGCSCVPPAGPSAPTCPNVTTARPITTTPITTRITTTMPATSTTTIRTTAITTTVPVTTQSPSTLRPNTTLPTTTQGQVTTAEPGTCSPTQYRCLNGQCISEFFVSDKQQDCSDNTDEVYCGKYLNCTGCAYSYFTHNWVCNCPTIRDGICYPGAAATECADMVGNGPVPSGVYPVVRPNCPQADVTECMTQIRCDFDTPGGPWIVIQRRITGTENFFRTWQDFKLGFGNKETGDFWQGNEYVSALTNRTGVTYSLLILVNLTNGQQVRAAYDRFAISPENYTLTLGKATEGEDNMALNRNRAFASMDRDVGGCAIRLLTGWWTSQNCNGIGDLNMPLRTIQWPGPNRISTVRATTMMIRAITAPAPPTSPGPTTSPGITSTRTIGRGGVEKPTLASSAIFLLILCNFLRKFMT